jgi:hypothetical protein
VNGLFAAAAEIFALGALPFEERAVGRASTWEIPEDAWTTHSSCGRWTRCLK